MEARRTRAFRPAEPGEYDAADLLDGPPRSPEAMEADLRELLATVQDPELRRLLDRFFAEARRAGRAFRDAPAAKHYHQAYRHGLLEHRSRSPRRSAPPRNFFPGIDREIAVTGALLHDIGKTRGLQRRSAARST